MARASFLLTLAGFLLVVALNRPSQCFILDEIGHSYVGVAAANFGATVREKENQVSPLDSNALSRNFHIQVLKKKVRTC